MTDCISIEIAPLLLNVSFIKDDLFHWSFKSVQIKTRPLLHVAQNVACFRNSSATSEVKQNCNTCVESE